MQNDTDRSLSISSSEGGPSLSLSTTAGLLGAGAVAGGAGADLGNYFPETGAGVVAFEVADATGVAEPLGSAVPLAFVSFALMPFLVTGVDLAPAGTGFAGVETGSGSLSDCTAILVTVIEAP